MAECVWRDVLTLAGRSERLSWIPLTHHGHAANRHLTDINDADKSDCDVLPHNGGPAALSQKNDVHQVLRNTPGKERKLAGLGTCRVDARLSSARMITSSPPYCWGKEMAKQA